MESMWMDKKTAGPSPEVGTPHKRERQNHKSLAISKPNQSEVVPEMASLGH